MEEKRGVVAHQHNYHCPAPYGCREEKPQVHQQDSPRRRTRGGPGVARCAWPKDPQGLIMTGSK